MTIIVNGEHRTIEPGQSLGALLRGLDLDPRGVVVERNRAIVRQPEVDAVVLQDGDQLEIVHFVGGG